MDTGTQGHTLGSVRLHRADTKEVILIPTPSASPDDPLNWSPRSRFYIAFITCLSVFITQFLAAGPSAAMIDIIYDIFRTTPADPNFPSALAKASYFFTTFALSQGISNLFLMPIIIKYGRRPVYLGAFSCFLVCTIWSANAYTFANQLAARITLAFFSGAADCLAPLTIADVTYLHERGLIMAIYSACLSSGVATGILITGFISKEHSWRIVNYIVVGLTGALLLAVFFTMPETAMNRNKFHNVERVAAEDTRDKVDDYGEKGYAQSRSASMNHIESAIGGGNANDRIPGKSGFWRRLRVFRPALTQESLFKIFVRPLPLLFLPPVLWATLVMSVSIGTFVAISANYATSFSQLYGFNSGQLGLVFLSVVVGSVIGVFGGGWLSDQCADWLTRRNNGLREPEMRLPTIFLSMIFMPVGCVMYGVGISKALHWMVPTIGIALIGFVITQSSNIVMVYVIDAYRPIAGEAVVVQLGFKAAFGFLLSFYLNPWIEKSGITTALGILAAINFGVFLLWIPLLVWGKEIRHSSMKWPIVKNVDWDDDREVGE